ncbi:MAG: HigA family addiction module antitoxin [Flavobacteriales bacterium]
MKINVKNLVPAYAIHPGNMLKDELDARDIKQNDFAKLIGYSVTQLNEIINGKRSINADFALLIGKALSIDPSFWMGLQSQYDLDKVKIEEKNKSRLEAIGVWDMMKDYVAVKYLKKLRWINGDPMEDIPKIKSLYKVNSIEEFPALYATGRFRKSTKLETDTLNLVAWTKVVSHKANDLEVGKFNHGKGEELIDKLKEILKDNKQTLFKTQSLLKDYGIKLIVEERPDKCPIDAYSFWSNGKPAIGITLRHKRIDNFSFNLFHELGHVFLHLTNNNTVDFIDYENDDQKYKNSIEEKQANDFASDCLIDKAHWTSFIKKSEYNDSSIKKFAALHNVHPAVVLGRLGHDLKIYPRTAIKKELK